MEICSVIFTLILVFPLILQLQMLILDPKKLCSIFHYYATTPEDTPDKDTSPQLLQHYLKNPIVVKSSSKISLTNLRTVSSSPTIARQLSSNAEINKKSSKSILLTVKHSCTFVKTDQVLPVVDISWNYSSYRYKTFDECLRNFYGDDYPPGEVVLNSMQLNLLDSRTNVSRSKASNLFDFVKDSELTLTGAVSRKLEMEYLNPLDHFVAKLAGKPSTEERSTETLRLDRSSDDVGSEEASYQRRNHRPGKESEILREDRALRMQFVVAPTCLRDRRRSVGQKATSEQLGSPIPSFRNRCERIDSGNGLIGQKRGDRKCLSRNN